SSGDAGMLAAETHGARAFARILPGVADDDGAAALGFGQRIKDAQDRPGLVEEDVALAVAVRTVAVVHWPAECGVRLGIAVAPDRQVMAGEQPRVLLIRAGRAENVRPAALQRTAGVPRPGAADLAVPVVARANRANDSLDQFLLWPRVDLAQELIV